MIEKITMNDMIMLSVDDHAIEPPDLFLGRMPAKYKDETPRVAQYANGDERWVVEGKAWGAVGAGRGRRTQARSARRRADPLWRGPQGHLGRRFLNIDPFQHIDRKDATVGALRARRPMSIRS
jgi:hypothetical protein